MGDRIVRVVGVYIGLLCVLMAVFAATQNDEIADVLFLVSAPAGLVLAPVAVMFASLNDWVTLPIEVMLVALAGMLSAGFWLIVAAVAAGGCRCTSRCLRRVAHM